MKYDDASWHFTAKDFPSDLPQSAGATHIGMFVVWAVLNQLMSEEFNSDFVETIPKLQLRQITPGQFVWSFMEGKFSSQDLSETGNAFAAYYYKSENPHSDSYLKFYESRIKGLLTSEYLLPDSWGTFDAVSLALDQAFQVWSSR